MEGLFSFEEEPEQAAPENTFSFIEDDKHFIPDNVAAGRAAKADIALGELSPGQESLHAGIAGGNEMQLRADHAAVVDNRKYQQSLDIVRTVASKEGRTLIPEEINVVMRTAQGANERTDPNTLWEKLYAVQYMKSFTQDDPEHNFVFGKAMEKEPVGTIDTLDRASNQQAWREIVATKYQDLDARWKQDYNAIGKIGQYAADFATMGLYGNYQLHNAVKEAPVSSMLPGRNMLEQVQYLHMLPIDKRKAVMDRVVDQLFKNHPPSAFKFLQAMNTYSASDVALHDAMGVLDPLLFFIPMGGGPKTMELAAAGAAGRSMTKDELARATLGVGRIRRQEQLDKTVTTPRPMTIREIMAAREGLGLDPNGFAVGPYSQGLPAGARPAGRMMTPGELATAKAGAPKADNPVTSFTMNGQQYKPTDHTLFVNPDELSAKMASSGDNPRRLFTDKDGNLAVSENNGRRWQPTGARITTFNEPQEGLVALNLGPARTSMGSKYFDQYRAEGRVEAVQRVGTAEPRQMSAQDIMRAREGVPWKLMDQSEIQLLRNATAQAIKAYDPLRPLNIQAVSGAMGNMKQAAALGAQKMISNRLQGFDPLGEGQEFVENIPSIMRGGDFHKGPSQSLSAPLAQKFADDAIVMNERLLNAVANPTRAPRLDGPALEAGIKAASEKWSKEAYFKSDGMIDIEHIPANNVVNVDYIGFNFGKTDKSFFDTPQQAEYWAKNEYKFHDGDYLVRQQGNRFKITIPRPLDETDPTVFAKMIATKNTETPVGLANLFIGWLRNSEDVLSAFNRSQRHIITHSPQELKSVLVDATKDISRLGKKDLRELEEILIENQASQEYKGMFFRDVAALETAWQRRFNKLPSPDQIKAYDTYVRLHDFDGMLRVLGWHRDASRLGVVNYRFSFPEGKSEWIAGRPGEIDWGSPHDAGILFFEPSSGKSQFVTKFQLKNDEKSLRSLMSDRIKNENYQVIQLYGPTHKPLASLAGTDDVVHYVVTPSVEHKRLMWGQGVDWRPGTHMVYQDLYFVKAPLVRTGSKGQETYFGDATIRAGGNSEKEAAALAKKYDDARLLLKAGDDVALDKFLRANLPESVSEFKKMFSGAGPGGGLSVDHPIVPTYTGRNTFESNTMLATDQRYAGLKEQATHPLNLEASLDKKFLAERGPILNRVANVGTESNPAFKLEPARLVDPLSTLNMALGNVIRSRFFTDYKQSVAAHWVKEFRDVIKAGTFRADQLERNPVYALYHAELDPAVVSRERYIAAREVRDRALLLLGTRSELGAAINRVEQTVMNKVYDAFGEGGTKWMAERPAVLGAIKDPANYMRAVAFHTKLGFFNPVQLIVQAQTMVHAMAIAPREAGGAMAAYFTSVRLRMTEGADIINYASRKVPGWKPEHFKEAHEAMRSRTGISHVGGETAWRDDMFDPQLFGGKTSQWLDKGLVFFKEGERAAREVAWFTAYREWRRANPTAVMDQRAIGVIENRWQTMTVDMTRASNASWQQGVFTIPTQFLTFNVRMMEQLLPGLSSRLSTAEKLRVVGAYSMLFGIPVGLSAGTGFLPFYDDVRKAAFDRNIDLNEGWIKMAHEGLMSNMVSWATGRDYNVAQRLGPGANNLFVEILKGNKDVLPLLAGPAGGVMMDMAKTSYPFLRHIWYATKGDDEQQYPITIEDFKAILQSENITTLSNAGKMLVGLNIGKYVSKNGQYVGDVTTMDSIFVGLGFTPQHITDAQMKSVMLRDEAMVKEKATQEFVKEFQRGLKADASGEESIAADHYKRARTIGKAAGFNEQDHSKAVNLGLTGYESQVDRVNRRMLERGSPERQNEMINNPINGAR